MGNKIKFLEELVNIFKKIMTKYMQAEFKSKINVGLVNHFQLRMGHILTITNNAVLGQN
jgi:hypothetical protein